MVANILICLIRQTNYLLDQLIRGLEKAFLEEGGPPRTHDPSPVGGARKTEEPLNKPAVRRPRSLKSSSRYYCTNVVHSASAKEKFRWFTPLQSLGPGR